MLRPSHTPDAVRAAIAPAKATKRRPIDPIYPTEKTKSSGGLTLELFVLVRFLGMTNAGTVS